MLWRLTHKRSHQVPQSGVKKWAAGSCPSVAKQSQQHLQLCFRYGALTAACASKVVRGVDFQEGSGLGDRELAYALKEGGLALWKNKKKIKKNQNLNLSLQRGCTHRTLIEGDDVGRSTPSSSNNGGASGMPQSLRLLVHHLDHHW